MTESVEGHAPRSPVAIAPNGAAGRATGWASARSALAGVVTLAAFAASGCTNPFSPEGTDPGVYKGQSDALFEQPADARDAALRERFELIQSR